MAFGDELEKDFDGDPPPVVLGEDAGDVSELHQKTGEVEDAHSVYAINLFRNPIKVLYENVKWADWCIYLENAKNDFMRVHGDKKRGIRSTLNIDDGSHSASFVLDRNGNWQFFPYFLPRPKQSIINKTIQLLSELFPNGEPCGMIKERLKKS